ncbi:MAG TPA: glycosyltransferase [Thiolapillus brandeum]|uniref:Glycosyltransferase n=1 Tax=Thiolapillus brandeum TaxID=1076588 RepID=A0A831KCE8_9GAMM|nr:glycosyltransferase [Thiolapillus brandeum]
MISIIIPCLNESAHIHATLECLQAMRKRGHEVIIVDGGSTDDSVDLARPLCDTLLQIPAGRARQMNAGAAIAQGDILWFLHADTLLASCQDKRLLNTLEQTRAIWGRFDIRLSGNRPCLRIIETAMNWRSRWTGIATGDQGIFLRKTAFQKIRGFADIPLMEDIDLSHRLKKSFGPPACLPHKLLASSRRWESHGVIRTVLLMWKLRLYYALGADPADLARLYR